MTREEASKLLNDYVDWAETDELNQDHPFIQSISPKDVFEAMRMGAKALANVWHTCKEEPKKDVPCVVCTNGKTVWTSFSFDIKKGETFKWAYIKDLLPESQP